MDFVNSGDRVRVIYRGEEILQSGPMKGRPAHQFTVLKADAEYSDTEAMTDSDEGLPEFDDL